MAIKVKHFSGPRIYGHVVHPEQAVRAGVLILPTIFGANEFAKGYAEVLAEAGLAAAVWDINSGLPLVTDYQECIRRARTLTDDAVAQMVGTWMDVMTAELGLEFDRTARLLHRRPICLAECCGRQARARLCRGLSFD